MLKDGQFLKVRIGPDRDLIFILEETLGDVTIHQARLFPVSIVEIRPNQARAISLLLEILESDVRLAIDSAFGRFRRLEPTFRLERGEKSGD